MAPPSFRAGVVAVVRRSDGLVLAFERSDVSDSWQLPQGGLLEGERPVHAAWRELAEETGLGPADVRLVTESPDWVVYELPQHLRKRRFIGQAQRWYEFAVLDDGVEPRPDGQEFVAWRWVEPSWLVRHVPEFRRVVYEKMLT
jgi:putative (di)nucleoside polyphosphate hydrolase